MNSKNFFALIALLFITCTKENNNQQVRTFVENNASDPVDALTPLNDLGTGIYNGYVGGLYPGGSNTPSGTYASDLLAVCKSIIPIDSFGNPSNVGKKGEVLFISMGGSTGADNMMALKTKTTNNPLTYSKLHLMNCNQAGQQAPLNFIMDPNSAYWGHVGDVLKLNKGSFRQVQIIYLETEDSTTSLTFPDRSIKVKNSLEACLRVMKQKCVNLKIVYVLGRTRVFGNNTPWNHEPSPYHFGWGCKMAIEDQINGVPGTEYKGGNAVAPMLTWGFYEWATTHPRKTDGFAWLASESRDGLHSSTAGKDSLSKRFQKFLLTDPYASKWYAAH
jgi:hypothetical protein